MRQIVVFKEGDLAKLKAFYFETALDLDIFYWPEFLSLEAEKNDAEFEVFLYREDNGYFFYAYLKKRLPETFGDFFDIQSPYGYCGPVANDREVFRRGEAAFMDYCSRQNIVSEFVRYHFFYNRDLLFENNIANEHNRTVLVLNTKKDWEKIWSIDFSAQNRTKVRKTEKEGFVFEIIDFREGMAEFMDMYRQTMDNARAKRYYYFENRYFEQMYSSLKDEIVLARIVRDGTTFASALFFRAADILTYHLGARNLEYPHVRATNLLMSRMAEFAHKEQIGFVNFGGGLTNAEDDSLFRFKLSFTKDSYPFWIGKRIHNQAAYEGIKEKWISIYGNDAFEQVRQMLQFYYET